jgi:acyl carrier protein
MSLAVCGLNVRREVSVKRDGMTRSEILGSIRDILAELVDQDTLQLSEQTTADEVAEWDSINHVKLLIALESELSIRFETDEVGGLKSVGGLIDLIQRKL